MIRKYLLTGILIISVAFICSTADAKKDKHKSLPPGLQKKVERGGELPPGWQKKIAKGEVLDLEVYKHATIIVPPDINGITTVKIKDKTLRLIHKTREIIDILND